MPPSLSAIQKKKIEAIRNAFHGKSLVVLGGALTAEAQEPLRRRLVWEQLQLATQLRQRHEAALRKAETECETAAQIRDVILQNAAYMNQLVSLTEAVQGKYVQSNDYQDYNEWDRKVEKERLERVNNANSILDELRQRIADPQRNWDYMTKKWSVKAKEDPEPEPEAPLEASFQTPTIEDLTSHPIESTAARLPDSFDDGDLDAGDADNDNDEDYVPTNPDSKVAKKTEYDGKKLPVADASVVRKRRAPPVTKSVPNAPVLKPAKQWDGGEINIRSHVLAMQERLTKKKREKKRKRKRSHDEEDGDGLPDEISTDGYARKSSERKRRRRLLTGPKTCHNCKSAQPDCLKCQFMFSNGFKCKKYYCMECVNRDYKDEYDPEKPSEWRCPSCLGSCKCNPCLSKRERAQRKQEKQTRSSRRGQRHV